ncbi:MAG TPA: DUF2946 family protein [Burkholderiales bacterium]|nr:DUF2946 family protein [Burkholderiales bacterium]
MVTWAASLALALGGVSPFVAQARPGLPPGLHDICSAAGAKKQVPGESGSHSRHCALCAVRADNPALPSEFCTTLVARSDFRHEVPLCPKVILAAFHASPPAPPRAPPNHT